MREMAGKGSTMDRVQKIACSEFENVYHLLTDFWGDRSEAKLKQIFEYRWQRDETYCGLALKDGDQAVGFIGLIFSKRRINEKMQKFCNLTSWFVTEKYRSRAVSLILPLLAMQDYTITDLTPSRKVYQIQKRLGFKDLDAKGRILLPFGRRLFQPKSINNHTTHDPAEIAKTLKAEPLKIFNDHKPYPCSHFLLTAKNRYCYIIYSKQKRKRLPYVHIHYISDLDCFADFYRDIRKAIRSHSNAFFIMIDARLVGDLSLPLSFSLPYRAPKQYLSSSLQPHQIDNLYSELILLNLRTHPRLKYLLRDIRRKMFGFEKQRA
jgi:hypothetical protein